MCAWFCASSGPGDRYPDLEIRRLGKVAHGTVWEIYTGDGNARSAWAVLADHIGNICALSYSGTHDDTYDMAVRYSRSGQIVEVDLLKQRKLTREFLTWWRRTTERKVRLVGALAAEEYRIDHHDNEAALLMNCQRHELRVLGGRVTKAA